MLLYVNRHHLDFRTAPDLWTTRVVTTPPHLPLFKVVTSVVSDCWYLGACLSHEPSIVRTSHHVGLLRAGTLAVSVPLFICLSFIQYVCDLQELSCLAFACVLSGCSSQSPSCSPAVQGSCNRTADYACYRSAYTSVGFCFLSMGTKKQTTLNVRDARPNICL